MPASSSDGEFPTRNANPQPRNSKPRFEPGEEALGFGEGGLEGEYAEICADEPSWGEFDGVFFSGDPEGGLGGEAVQVLGAVAVVVGEAALGGDLRAQRFQRGAQRRGAARAA